MNYEVSLKERKGILYAHYYEGSKLVKKSLRLKATKQNLAYAARHVLPNLQAKLASGQKLFSSDKVSVFFDKIMSRYGNKSPSTLAVYKIAFRHFTDYFGDVDIQSITVLDMDGYIEHLFSTLSSASLRVYLSPVSLVFREAIRLDVIFKNPVTYALKPSVVKTERRVYTVMQVWQFLDNADFELCKFLYIAFYTGLRAGEICALKWSDIDFERNTISITKSKSRYGIGKTKSRKDRVIPLLHKLRVYLLTLESRNDNVLEVGYLALRLRFKALCERLGFFYEGLHNTRHTFTSLMLAARENPLLVRDILGHSSMDMMDKIYAHYVEDNAALTRFSTIMEQSFAEAL